MEKIIKVYVPKWAIILYALIAIALIPWIFDLASNLPTRHLDRNWDILWVGFDIMMLLAIVITVILMFKKTVWVIVSATALATFFLIDVWFDVLTSRPGKEQREAIFFGILEVSLSILTYRMVYKVIHHTTIQKNMRLTSKKIHKAS